MILDQEKTNALLNLILHQQDTDKIYLHTKDLNEPKHQLLIKKRKNTGIRHCNDPKAFMEYSNTMDDVYKIILAIKILKETEKILIVFDDMIADINTNKKF